MFLADNFGTRSFTTHGIEGSGYRSSQSSKRSLEHSDQLISENLTFFSVVKSEKVDVSVYVPTAIGFGGVPACGFQVALAE